MSERGTALLATADGQIEELISLVSGVGESGLMLPCPGREQLGDGTVAACVAHTTGRYRMIGEFLRGIVEVGMTGGHGSLDTSGLPEQLAAARQAFAELTELLTDERLASVPAAGSFRFCDGQRTLEQVFAGLLKHQAHQVEAVRVALGGAQSS
jgi:hypothetical protein